MTQNLRLGSDSEMTLTPANTDTSSNFVLPAVQTSGDEDWRSDNGTAAHVYQQDINYGNLYNWIAATVNTGANIAENAEATGSICPKNWRLPPYSGTGSYSALFSAAGISKTAAGMTTVTSAPYSFVYSGSYTHQSAGAIGYGLQGQGTFGIYWTRTSSVNGSGMDELGQKPQIYLLTLYSSDYPYTSNSFTVDIFSTSQEPSLITSSQNDIEASTKALASGNYRRYFGYSIRCYFSS